MNSASQHTSGGHELRDARIRPIVLTAIFLGVLVALVCIGMAGLFRFLGVSSPAVENPMSTPSSQIPPKPRIEEHPAVEIQQLHNDEDRTLSTFGWADRKQGKVRIPIERAIELQLQRGFPALPPNPKREAPRK
jgi:hypothetical protein